MTFFNSAWKLKLSNEVAVTNILKEAKTEYKRKHSNSSQWGTRDPAFPIKR
jgi:hypothetical protein